MNITNPVCIDLDQPGLTGFRHFISSWLYCGENCNLLVDPGPLSTIPHLLTQLQKFGVERLDYILLTHIHIDHAGGTGALLRAFPQAKVICHPEGIRHLADPAKLWEGSRKVLGRKLADAYGEILPVPQGNILFEQEIGRSGVRAFLTPGHAQHHCCYLLDDILFAGEVAGARCAVPQGIYIRPATPPRFILEVALDSVDRMIALKPQRLVFAHYGLVDRGIEHLKIARNQLLLWVEGVKAVATVAAAGQEEALQAWLMEHDENYRNINQLPEDIRSRELYFFGNTFRGMAEYVAANPLKEPAE